jgi:hypothetical protein
VLDLLGIFLLGDASLEFATPKVRKRQHLNIYKKYFRYFHQGIKELAS